VKVFTTASPIDPGPAHRACRIAEFIRWSRVMLEHEREHLSKVMAGRAFMREDEVAGVMHDLTDIDYVLSYHPPRIEVPK
jgi:hypothetical protein